jgi:hypothetical protein
LIKTFAAQSAEGMGGFPVPIRALSFSVHHVKNGS